MHHYSSPSTNLNVRDRSTLKAWWVCLTAALFFFYEFIQMNMLSSLNIDLQQAFGVNGVELGILGSSYFLANVIFLIPAGLMLDRFSTKKIILVSLGLCILGTYLFSRAGGLSEGIVYRFMTGIGSAFCFLCCVRLATRWFPGTQLAFITGLIVTLAMLGGTVAQAPMTWLVEHVGWRHAVTYDAALGVLIFLLIFWNVEDYPEHMAHRVSDQQDHARAMGYWQSLAKALLRSQNWLSGLYTSLMNLPIFLLGALWGGQFLQQIHGFSREEASAIVSMIYMGCIVGAPFMGWVSDRMGRRVIPMALGSILSMLCFAPLLMGIQASVTGFMALFFLLGFITSTQVISYPLVAERNPSALTATSVCAVSICSISGGVIFHPFSGWLLDRYWDGTLVDGVHIYGWPSYRAGLLVMMLAFGAALLITRLTRESFCRPSEREGE